MKNIFMKSMTVLTLIMVALCGVNQGKTEAASKAANQDLIIINKYNITSLHIFIMVILKSSIR